MRLMITGAAGLLGLDAAHAALAAGHDLVALTHAELDITDGDAVSAQLRRLRPDCVLNCAAFTDVDGAESAPGRAQAVNAEGAGNLARAAADVGAWLVHISSDYVFDGGKREPYVESDPVAPLSQYGRSKLDGEEAVSRAAPERHTIVRSSWLFGTGGPCFPATILRLAGEREQLSVVDDQIGCPTFTGHLAPALIELAERRVPGLVHVAGGGQCSWYDFALEIVRRSGSPCRVTPGRSADLPRPAPRPAFSALATERGVHAPRLADWREGLGEFMSAVVRT